MAYEAEIRLKNDPQKTVGEIWLPFVPEIGQELGVEVYDDGEHRFCRSRAFFGTVVAVSRTARFYFGRRSHTVGEGKIVVVVDGTNYRIMTTIEEINKHLKQTTSFDGAENE